jgi:hypothetical protein
MKKVLSVSLGSPRDDFTVEVQLLGRQVELSRVGTDGSWERALELIGRSDRQVAAVGLEGVWRPHDRRLQAARALLPSARLADGITSRPILARRVLAALEAHLNKSGGSLETMTSLLPVAARSAALAEALGAFGCPVIAGDLLFALGLDLPLRRALAVRAASRVVGFVRERNHLQMRGGASRWQRLVQQVQLVAWDGMQNLAALYPSFRDKIVVLETAAASQETELLDCGVRVLALAAPRIGGRTVSPAAVEALLLSVIEKPEAEIEASDMESAVARAPLRPQLLVPA